MSNKAWERAEQIMSEELGCSMREARENYELIASFGEKFLDEPITAGELVDRVTSEMTEPRLSQIYKSEMIIQLNYLIANINVNKCVANAKYRNVIKQDIADARALWNLITNSIMPIEIFWAIEQHVEKGGYLTEEEQRLYDYMVRIADRYLIGTSEVEKYISHAEISKAETTLAL